MQFSANTVHLKRIAVLLVIVISAYLLSTIIVSYPKNIKFALLVPVVLFFLVSRPGLLFFLGFLIIFNGYGLMRINFTVGGMFKTYDVGLLMCGAAGAIFYYNRFRGRVDIFRSPIAVMTLVFTGYIFFEVLLTVVGTGQSFKMSLQMGRHFFPLLLYFFSVPILLSSDKWKKIIPWVVALSAIGAFFYVTNFNPLSVAGKVYSNTIDGVEVERRYGSLIYGPIFVVGGGLFAYLIMGRIKKMRFLYWGMLAVIALQPILSFGRGYIIAFFTQIAMVLFNAPIERSKRIRIMFAGAIIFVLTLSVVSIIQYSDAGQLADLFFSRMASAKTDFFQKTGTYKLRSKINSERMELVKQYPVFGAGLIHPDAGLYPELEGIVSTGHSGYISLLAPLGILGFILFVLYTVVIYMSALKVIKLEVPFIYKAIALTATGSVIQGYPRMFSTASFISFRSLSELAVLAAILQVCIYKSKHGYFAPDDNETLIPPRHA